MKNTNEGKDRKDDVRFDEKEFNLSEKIVEGFLKGNNFVWEDDVKEFIRLLKEWGDNERKNNNIFRKSQDELNEDWMEKITKLAGEKLR